MRYFLVTFSLSDKLSLGTICFDHDGFFSYDELFAIIQKQYPYARGVVIVNIYEFSDRQDFIKYKGETPGTLLDQYVAEAKIYASQKFGIPAEQISILNNSSLNDYYQRNVPLTEAVSDMILRQFQQ